MLYLYYGKDGAKIKDSQNKLADSLIKKKPESERFKLDSDNFSESVLDELIGGQGLFEKKYVVTMSGLLEDTSTKEILLERVEQVYESPNIFILSAISPDAKTKKKLEKYSHKSHEVAESISKRKNEFNVFALSDSLGNRDSSALWSLYREALFNGVSPEEIHAILVWQIRVLLGISNSEPTALGIKPFVASKARKFLNNYSVRELEKISTDLVSVYHNARRGLVDIEVGIERVILSI